MKRSRMTSGLPGIVEVADRAGVSIATVSRVFNEPDKVRALTKSRVKTAANELGYIRNRLAGSMHNRFSGTVGLIVPTIDNAIFAEMIEAFGEQLRLRDRSMLIAAHGYDLTLEVAIVRSLLERRVDGLALIGFEHDPVSMNMLQQRKTPVISMWNYSADSTVPCVGADNSAAATATTRHVLELGHRDIAFMFPESSTNDRARDRKAGAMKELHRAGLNIQAHRLIACPYEIGEAKRLALLQLQTNRPTAFVCGNDIIAHGVYYACQALGLLVPDDVSIVGIGDFRGSAHLEPGLTTVKLPASSIGRTAANTIVEMSDNGYLPDLFHNRIDVEFKQRGSTARPRI